jgi:hypothetical protein
LDQGHFYAKRIDALMHVFMNASAFVPLLMSLLRQGTGHGPRFGSDGQYIYQLLFVPSHHLQLLAVLTNMTANGLLL